MGFHGRKRNGGIVLRDRRLAARWERTQERRAAKVVTDGDSLIAAILASPEGGQTEAPKPKRR